MSSFAAAKAGLRAFRTSGSGIVREAMSTRAWASSRCVAATAASTGHPHHHHHHHHHHRHLHRSPRSGHAPGPSDAARHRRPLRIIATTTTSSARGVGGVRNVSARASSSSTSPSDEEGGGARKHRLVFLGTPDVAAGALSAIFDAAETSDAAFEVHAVVSQPGRPRGRGRKSSGPPPPSPVAALAATRGVPEDLILCPVKANEDDFLATLRAMDVDLMVTAAYGNFLPQRFLDIPRLGTLNIHPSLLPQFRGAAPVQRALEAGVDVTGVSVAYTVLKMDAGPVLRRIERPLLGDEKHPELLEELFGLGARALVDALPDVWSGAAAFDAGTTPQESYGEASHAAKVSVEESELDFCDGELSARRLHDKVRGFAGWPGTKATFAVRKETEAAADAKEVSLKIVTTRVGGEGEGDDAAARAAGTVVIRKDCMRVPCAGGGWLEITELQPPGKKAMSARDYVNGLKGSVVAVKKTTTS